MAAAFVGADSAQPTAVEALDVTVLRAEWAIESERGGPPLGVAYPHAALPSDLARAPGL